DFGFVADLAQRGLRGRGHTADYAKRRSFNLRLDLIGRIGAGELDRHLEAEFHIRDLGLEHCGIAVRPDLRKVAHAVNTRGKEARIAQLVVDSRARRLHAQLAGELHCRIRAIRAASSAAITSGSSSGVRWRALASTL